MRKVTQTTKTANEKDQPTEIATESALLRFFHQLTAQQMIDIDTAFHCQQKNCFIRMSSQMHQIITRNRVIVLRSSHLGITLVFSKKIDSDGHSPAHVFSKKRWGCSSWCFGVVWKREMFLSRNHTWKCQIEFQSTKLPMLNHWWMNVFPTWPVKQAWGRSQENDGLHHLDVPAS